MPDVDSSRPGLLARRFGIGFILQLGGAALAYALQLCLARWMGATAYGSYAWIVSWSGILAIVAGMGFPTLVLRLLPDFSDREDWGRVRGLLVASVLGTFLVGAVVALLGIALAVCLHWRSHGSDLATVWGFVLVPLGGFVALGLEIVRSFRRIGLAYAPSLILLPCLVIGAGAVVVAGGGRLHSRDALAFTAAATAAVVVFQAWRFRAWLRGIAASVRPVYERALWVRQALPLLLVAGFIVVLDQTDVVMVGALRGDRAAGLYNAATQTAGVVALILVAANAIGAPMFSTLFAQKRQKDLQELVSTITAWAFWPSCLLAIVLAVAAPLVLKAFGSGFSAAAWQLRVLLIGQIVNAAAGSVGWLILLSGRPRVAARVYGWVALIHLVLLGVLIPVFGTVGAAIAATLTFSLWNIWLHAVVARDLGIRASILSSLRLASAA